MATFSELETDRAHLNIKSIGATRIVNRQIDEGDETMNRL